MFDEDWSLTEKIRAPGTGLGTPDLSWLPHLPDLSGFGSVDQLPSVGGVILPANVLGIMPQSTHLQMIQNKVSRTFQTPNSIECSHDSLRTIHTCPSVSPVCHKAFLRCSPRSCGRVHYFNGQSRVTLCFSGCMRPVGLCDLFPHHHIET